MTLEEIYQALAAEFREQTGLTAGGSSELAVRFYAVAAQIYGLYVQAEWTRRQCFPQTAVGEDLDRHAFLRNISRRQGVKATGTVRFYLEGARQADTVIRVGTVCMTATGTRFLTTEEGSVPAGEVHTDVPVEAAEVGAEGNAAPGTIVYMALPPTWVVACANTEALVNGQDEESDEDLRVRVLESYHRLANGANNAFYQQAAMSFDGIAAVTVLPRNRGVGTVDVVAAAQGGAPDESLLKALQEYFDRVREIACDVKVVAPTLQTVNLTVSLTAEQDREFDTVAQAVRETLEGWFTGERLGKPLLLAELTTLIFGVDGVANCAVTQPAADLSLNRVTLPVLGELTINKG